ncbi:MAG: hypothetical protein AAF492_13585, partial [Verrucomicrobiota bacterium]
NFGFGQGISLEFLCCYVKITQKFHKAKLKNTTTEIRLKVSMYYCVLLRITAYYCVQTAMSKKSCLASDKQIGIYKNNSRCRRKPWCNYDAIDVGFAS